MSTKREAVSSEGLGRGIKDRKEEGAGQGREVT